jgi:hypothetical protein
VTVHPNKNLFVIKPTRGTRVLRRIFGPKKDEVTGMEKIT